jgi:hypothetical protein
MSEATTQPTLPAAADFFVRTPLYEFFPITEADHEALQDIFYPRGTLDAYCVHCRQISIFRRSFPTNTNYLTPSEALALGQRDTSFACTRKQQHDLWFRTLVRRTAGESDQVQLGKIGQWPSVADLLIVGSGKYRAILGPSRYRELTRAIGLAAHGVGIGSFVYLRRIFESLVYEAFEQATSKNQINQGEFDRARMDERITLLKDYLPRFLVDNHSMYGILSKGIHSLTEEECLRYFDTLRTGIELVLDERLEEMKRANKLTEAKNAIARARGDLAE